VTQTVAEIQARSGSGLMDGGPVFAPLGLRDAGKDQGETGAPSSSRLAARGEASAPVPAAGSSFLSTQLSESGFIPPDTTGAVGPTQVATALNGRIKFFDKAGTQQFSATLNAFFASIPAGGNAFDPRVEYDRLSGRWFVSAAKGGADNTIMLAVSSGPTITGTAGFTFFSFVQSSAAPAGDAGRFADFPTLATDRNAVYIGTNNFSTAGAHQSSSLFVIRKADLLAAAPVLTVTAFRNVATSSAGTWSPQGVENDDPAATDGYLIGVDNAAFGQLNFRRITNPGATPVLGPEIDLPVPDTSDSSADVRASGSTTNVDAIDDRLYEAMVARDPGSGELRLWTGHNMEMNAAGAAVAAGDRIGARWYEYGNLGGTPSLVQAGSLVDGAVDPSPQNYWVPAIAANGQGHAVLASSTSAADSFVGIAAAQRVAGDPAGTLSTPLVVQPGLGAYTALDGLGRNRWGDYSQVSIDPTDNQTFWAFQEYANATNSWGVRVVQIRARPPATPSSAQPSVVRSGQSVNVTVTGVSTDGSAFFDPGPDVGGPGYARHISAAVSGEVAVNTATYVSPTTVVLNLNTASAPEGLKGVTITNPDGQAVTATIMAVDNTPPETSIVTAPHTLTRRRRASVAFTSSEPGSSFTCSLDGGPFAACATPGVVTSLAEGPHRFRVRATDIAGNTDPTAAQTAFEVDATAPNSKIRKHPRKRTRSRRARFTFASTERGSQFQCKLDRKRFRACRSPKRLKKLKPGVYRLRVRALDAAGNRDATPAVYKWRVLRRSRRR